MASRTCRVWSHTSGCPDAEVANRELTAAAIASAAAAEATESNSGTRPHRPVGSLQRTTITTDAANEVRRTSSTHHKLRWIFT